MSDYYAQGQVQIITQLGVSGDVVTYTGSVNPMLVDSGLNIADFVVGISGVTGDIPVYSGSSPPLTDSGVNIDAMTQDVSGVNDMKVNTLSHNGPGAVQMLLGTALETGQVSPIADNASLLGTTLNRYSEMHAVKAYSDTAYDGQVQTNSIDITGPPIAAKADFSITGISSAYNGGIVLVDGSSLFTHLKNGIILFADYTKESGQANQGLFYIDDGASIQEMRNFLRARRNMVQVDNVDSTKTCINFVTDNDVLALSPAENGIYAYLDGSDEIQFGMRSQGIDLVKVDTANNALDLYSAGTIMTVEDLAASGQLLLRSQTDASSFVTMAAQNNNVTVTSTGVNLNTSGASNVYFSNIKLPNADGTAGQVLQTDGAGTITFATPASGAVTVDITIDWSDLDFGDAKSLVDLSGSTFAIRSMVLNLASSAWTGGNRDITIKDAPSGNVLSVIPSVSIAAGTNIQWNQDIDFPYPTGFATNIGVTQLVAEYSGGTTDYTTGTSSLTITYTIASP